jgi:hypothetical protein
MDRSNALKETRGADGLPFLLIATGVIWFGALMTGRVLAFVHGPICHHGSWFGPHCAGCYSALALAALGAAILGKSMMEPRSPRAVTASTPARTVESGHVRRD